MRRLSLKTFALLFALTFLLVSCEKEVHIHLAGSPTQLVVQGAVETGQPPYVFLTSTIGFFSTVDLATLEASFLHGAIITVSNGTKTITLKEYSFDTGSGNKFYIYSVDTAALATDFMLGEVGKFYSLSITYNGKTYTSITKIPAPKGIDSMWFDIPLSANSKIPPNAKQLFVNYTDPDSFGNYVRAYTQINSQPFYASDQFNDEVVNGAPLTNIPLYAGFDDVQNANQDSLRYFYSGDTVTLKWSEIDKAVYDFWNSYSYAANAAGNPFASPINLKTNISNGGLGVWAGYGSLFFTRVVP
jgi:hypothetical protein